MYTLLNCSIFLILFQCVNSILLETKQGTLNGITLSSRDGRLYHAFYSIPYAEPPVGEFRFQSPIPAKSWQGVRDATVLPPACISIEDSHEIVGKEDCLYLNVYTPKISNNTRLPVMVFIYGGRYMYGNSLPSRYGPQYFMDEDVVLITFHYRLGIFGFLSTEDEVIPGNYGLKDTVAVLRWVQEYIDAFGGDKNRVTVLGGSSGAESAGLLLISPLAEGLFHRVISQSGNPLTLEDRNVAKFRAWKLASLVGCDDETVTNSEALLNCLKAIPAKKLVENNLKFYTFGHVLPFVPLGPVIENEKVPGAFLVDEPRKLIGRKTDIPWIVGMNSADGGMITIFTYFTPELTVIEEFDKNYKKYFPIIFQYGIYAKNSEEVDRLTEKIKNYYFGDKRIKENPHGFTKMFTCLGYLPGIKEMMKLYQGPKYVYYYDHRNKDTFGHMYAEYEGDMGVIHGDELISMFNWTEVITPVTEGVDYVVSKQVIKLWTNFAAKGDPNTDGEEVWRPVDSPDINYLHIKDGILETREALLKSEYEFLESLQS